MGRRAEAETILHEVEAVAQQEPVLPELVAQVHVVLGNIDDAFAWLERGLEARSASASAYPEHPDFAPLRRDPRWQRRLARLNLH
jgi:hypothetical protein